MSQTTILDKRDQRGRSSPSRQRLLRKIDGSIKNAIPDIVEKNSIDQLTNDEQKIFVPMDSLAEPHFVYDDHLGRRYRFYSGNDKFLPGDKIPRPPGDGGLSGEKEASSDPKKEEDQFGIILSRDEFLQYFYKDLELPLLEEKKTTHSLDQYRWVHAGTTHYGPPPRLNVISSLSNSLGRRIALNAVFAKRIKGLQEELEEEQKGERSIDDGGVDVDINFEEKVGSRIMALQEEIRRNERKQHVISYLEDVDLRFNHFTKEPIPINSAVMFCLMDVSASMSKEEKDIAKRFYFFLYLMLTLNYDNVHIVWIRHTTDAKRVLEEEFFNSRETGGTIVSSSLELANKIRLYGDEMSPGGYPTKSWNIYFAQATDGDNSYDDMDTCVNILTESLMKSVNHFSYIQIRSPSENYLWKHYLNVQKKYPKRFQMRHINNRREIWGVFSDLFKKRTITN